MKKLIMFAAVAVATVCVNAASVSWTLAKNSIMNQDGSAAKGVDVYFLNASATAYAETLSKIASGDIDATSISSSGAYLGSGTTGTTNAKAGSVARSASTANGDSLTAGNNYDIVFVTFEKVGSDNYYYVSNTQSASAWGGTTYTEDLATPASWTSDNFSAASWKTVSSGGGEVVPEPTSGLLLLVGGAMLALRRKQK